jgi:hypothetical protein
MKRKMWPALRYIDLGEESIPFETARFYHGGGALQSCERSALHENEMVD